MEKDILNDNNIESNLDRSIQNMLNLNTPIGEHPLYVLYKEYQETRKDIQVRYNCETNSLPIIK